MEGVSQERFMMEHLKTRISEVVSDYEARLGIEALRLTMSTQELERMNAENNDLRTKIASLEQEIEDLKTDKSDPISERLEEE